VHLTAILSDVIRNVQFITKEVDELVIRQGDQGDWSVVVLGKVFLVVMFRWNGRQRSLRIINTMPIDIK